MSNGGSLRQITLPYDNFQLNAIIDPYEHNANNAELVVKINQMVTVLNSFINDEANLNLTAMAVHMPAVEPIPEQDLESFLRELIGLIRSTEPDASGAHFVKSATIQGIPGDNIWEQLANISESVTGIDPITGDPVPGGDANTLAGKLAKVISDLNTHKSSADHDGRYFTKQNIQDILDGKVFYDTATNELTPFPAGSNKEYLRTDGDLKGTFGGYTVEELRSASGTGFGTIEVLASDPINPKVGRIWIISGQGGEG